MEPAAPEQHIVALGHNGTPQPADGVAVVAVDHGIDSPGANDVEAANEDAEDDDAEALAGEARDSP